MSAFEVLDLLACNHALTQCGARVFEEVVVDRTVFY